MINKLKALINKIKKQIQQSDNADFQNTIVKLEKELTTAKQIIINKNEVLKEAEEVISILKLNCKASDETVIKLAEELAELKARIEESNDPLESYWNNKITPSTVTYAANRNSNKKVDVRIFLNSNNDLIKPVTGKTNDIKASRCLTATHSRVKYTQKNDVAHGGEYWQFANETWKLKTGDCEDGAIMMANMMIKSGIPYWRIRLNAGSVQGGGHAYVTYLREEDNTWYIMDWCYWYSASTGFKKKWIDAKKYFGIWFSWNLKYAFKKSTLDRA